MSRFFYSDTIEIFLQLSVDAIIGKLASSNSFNLEATQRDAWIAEIQLLKIVLAPYQHSGKIYFEYTIPRLGKRIDVVAIIGSVIFIMEFKNGKSDFASNDIDQVWDYALDLQNFHEPSHSAIIAPILIATKAKASIPTFTKTLQNHNILEPIKTNAELLPSVVSQILQSFPAHSIDPTQWEQGRYCPTPTIIEAAKVLYAGHSVKDISRRDTVAINLDQTSETISQIIQHAKVNSLKTICFVTGVPGAGKTLVGLDIATKYNDKNNNLYSVFLSGNGPLVNILCEALARDKVDAARTTNTKLNKKDAHRMVSGFIQNVHHFRDDSLENSQSPPIEHVALFDEAQRAWNLKQTADFMLQKKDTADFNQSEPEFLISCLDRHHDWAVIVCLVGGGQEINKGEAGISEWIESLIRSFPDWQIHISPHLTDSEYTAQNSLQKLANRPNVFYREDLHLAISLRSFRSEKIALFVKQLLDLQLVDARDTLEHISKYPIVVTRNISQAKNWLKNHASGSERYGIIVSSQAHRLKPFAVDVRIEIDPIHWFLNGKEDVRSSYYLEDVATEFQVQGLELDWTCVIWDADFRYNQEGWEHWEFRGNRWQCIRSEDRKAFLKNAYRVLLTRARQGMVIVVPDGDPDDPTRSKNYYDPTFEFLKDLGLKTI